MRRSPWPDRRKCPCRPSGSPPSPAMRTRRAHRRRTPQWRSTEQPAEGLRAGSDGSWMASSGFSWRKREGEANRKITMFRADAQPVDRQSDGCGYRTTSGAEFPSGLSSPRGKCPPPLSTAEWLVKPEAFVMSASNTREEHEPPKGGRLPFSHRETAGAGCACEQRSWAEGRAPWMARVTWHGAPDDGSVQANSSTLRVLNSSPAPKPTPQPLSRRATQPSRATDISVEPSAVPRQSRGFPSQK